VRVTEGKQLPVIQPGKAPGEPPVFERVGVVGLGLIGGSIALAARQAWPSSLVIGVDNKDILERAMVLHAIDVAADDLIVLAEADLVILAAPIHQNLELLHALPDYIAGPAIVTDTGSTKLEIVRAASSLPERFTFIGGHPLGGAARGGIEHARADLFKGRPWLFTPTTERVSRALEQLQAFASGLGAHPRLLSPGEHDHLLAFISHLPQLTVSALMHVVGEAVGKIGLELSGRGLVDTTRLASSPAGIWKEVCATNPTEIAAALDALIELLGEFRADLTNGKSIQDAFDSANRWREVLLAERS
jgi:prephenate dehydrogenase